MPIPFLNEFKEEVSKILNEEDALSERRKVGDEYRDLDGNLSRTFFKQKKNAIENPDEFIKLDQNKQDQIIDGDKEYLRSRGLNWAWKNHAFSPKQFLLAHPDFWANYLSRPNAKKKDKGNVILDKEKFVNSLQKFIDTLPEQDRINAEELMMTNPDDSKTQVFNTEHPFIKNKANRAAFADKMFNPWYDRTYGTPAGMGFKSDTSVMKRAIDNKDANPESSHWNDFVQATKARTSIRGANRMSDDITKYTAKDIVGLNDDLEGIVKNVVNTVKRKDPSKESYVLDEFMTGLEKVQGNKKLQDAFVNAIYDQLNKEDKSSDDYSSFLDTTEMNFFKRRLFKKMGFEESVKPYLDAYKESVAKIINS